MEFDESMMALVNYLMTGTTIGEPIEFPAIPDSIQCKIMEKLTFKRAKIFATCNRSTDSLCDRNSSIRFAHDIYRNVVFNENTREFGYEGPAVGIPSLQDTTRKRIVFHGVVTFRELTNEVADFICDKIDEGRIAILRMILVRNLVCDPQRVNRLITTVHGIDEFRVSSRIQLPNFDELLTSFNQVHSLKLDDAPQADDQFLLSLKSETIELHLCTVTIQGLLAFVEGWIEGKREIGAVSVRPIEPFTWDQMISAFERHIYVVLEEKKQIRLKRRISKKTEIFVIRVSDRIYAYPMSDHIAS